MASESNTGRIASGRNRPGRSPASSSMCQSLYADTTIFVRSRSTVERARLMPLKPAIVGKHMDASTPLASMSLTRRSRS
jgi:hypothetical protein